MREGNARWNRAVSDLSSVIAPSVYRAVAANTRLISAELDVFTVEVSDPRTLAILERQVNGTISRLLDGADVVYSLSEPTTSQTQIVSVEANDTEPTEIESDLPDPLPADSFKGFSLARFTQVPNDAIDETIRGITGNCCKLMLVVMRQTVGTFDKLGTNRAWWVTSISAGAKESGLSRSAFSRALDEGEKIGMFVTNRNPDHDTIATWAQQFRKHYKRPTERRELIIGIRCNIRVNET